MSGAKTWTEGELKILQEMWPNLTNREYLLELLSNHTEVSIRIKASRMGLKCAKAWTTEEDVLLKDIFSKTDPASIASLFPRWDEEAIWRRAYVLGLTRNTDDYWNEDETNYLKDNHPKMSLRAIAKGLKRSISSVKAKAGRLGLFKLKEWSEEENEILRKHYFKLGQTKLLKLLPGRAWAAISSHASRLGLRRMRNLYRCEFMLRQILDEIFPNEVHEDRTKPEWLINPNTGKTLELDRYYPNLNLAFEYNGEQHYNAVYIHNNSTPEKIQAEAVRVEKRKVLDKIKEQVCSEYGVNLITVSYQDKLTTDNIRTIIERRLSCV